jgi:DNA-binding transcriptional regulator GbsR (MarR family)
MKLTPAVQKFILHWGEMGSRWGINRTVAQIHALLYVTGKPLHAEEISETLGFVRSNVSNSIKELQGWGIVKVVHVMNDRRDHFESLKDPWQMFQIILDERKHREIDPTLDMLRECMAEAERTHEADTHEKLKALFDFFQTMIAWYDQARKLPVKTLLKVVQISSKVRRFAGGGAS